MSSAANTKKRGRRRFVLIGFAAVIVVGGGIALAASLAMPTSAPTATPTAVAKAAPAIRAKGSIVPVRQTKLAFGSSGQVQTLAVKPGDAVKAGQVLVALDPRESDLKVKTAEDTLALAEIALAQAERAASPEEIAAAEAALAASQARVQEVGRGSDRSDVLAAESALSQARETLNQTEAAVTAEEKNARAALDSANARLAALQAGPSVETVREAEIRVEQAKSSLWATQIQRDGVCGYGVDSSPCKSADAQVSASEQGVRAAEASLAKVKAGAAKDDLAAARAAIDQAQATLDQKIATREGRLASAKSGVVAAESRLQRLRSGASQSDVKVAESNVARDRATLATKRGDGASLDLKAAKLRVAQAQTGLAQAQLARESTRVVAPYDGVAAAVLVAVHDAVTPGATAIVLADPSAVRVESNDLDESVVSKLSVGQPVKVTIAAFPDKVLAGTIAQIRPLATTTEDGNVSYPIVVTLDRPDPEVRWGMTARLEFTPAAPRAESRQSETRKSEPGR